MTHEEIETKLQIYKEDLPFDDQEEKDLIGTISQQDYVTSNQLERIIRWKLEDMGGRADINVGRMQSIPGEAVEHITRAAFLVTNPQTQLKVLNGIPGVGYATATVILAFHDPDSYAVGDRIINGVIFGEEKYVSPSNYVELLAELEKLRPSGYTLRETEKALYIGPYLD